MNRSLSVTSAPITRWHTDRSSPSLPYRFHYDRQPQSRTDGGLITFTQPRDPVRCIHPTKHSDTTMPLNSTAKPAQKHDLLAAVAGSTKIATRSITPQPSVPQNRGRERNLPGFDRHHSRSNSENGFTGAQNPPLRPDDLKIPVRNALAKSASSLPQALAAHSGRAKDVSVKQKLHKSSDVRNLDSVCPQRHC